MSVQATTWVWEHSKAENAGLLVMLAIADAANREGAASMQSIPTLARMCRITERHAARCIAKLIEMGELEKTGQSQRYGTTVYRLPGMGPDPRYPSLEPLTPESGGQYVRGDIGEPDPLTSATSTPDPQVTQPQRTPQEDDPTSSSPDGDGEGAATTETLESEFAAWWEEWPAGRKVARKDAFKAFVKARTEASADTIMEGLRAHLPVWLPMIEAGTKSKVPHPATWLNGGRWEDRPTPDPVEEHTEGEPELDPADWMKRRTS